MQIVGQKKLIVFSWVLDSGVKTRVPDHFIFSKTVRGAIAVDEWEFSLGEWNYRTFVPWHTKQALSI